MAPKITWLPVSAQSVLFFTVQYETEFTSKKRKRKKDNSHDRRHVHWPFGLFQNESCSLPHPLLQVFHTWTTRWSSTISFYMWNDNKRLFYSAHLWNYTCRSSSKTSMLFGWWALRCVVAGLSTKKHQKTQHYSDLGSWKRQTRGAFVSLHVSGSFLRAFCNLCTFSPVLWPARELRCCTFIPT